MLNDPNNIPLPSEKKFGFLFAVIFSLASAYFYFNKIYIALYIFGLTALFFFVITIFQPILLRPLNKTWMKLGYFLGMIISPIIMGSIFFLIFTPLGIFMRLFNRDVLNLRLKKKSTYWIVHNESIQSNSLKYQF